MWLMSEKRNAAFPHAIFDGVKRQAIGVLRAVETFLFNRGDDLAIDNESCGRVVEDFGQPIYAQRSFRVPPGSVVQGAGDADKTITQANSQP